jgi:hypothetical protein
MFLFCPSIWLNSNSVYSRIIIPSTSLHNIIMCFKKSLTYFGVQALCSPENSFRLFCHKKPVAMCHKNQIFIGHRVQEVHCCAEHDERSHSRKTTNFCPKSVGGHEWSVASCNRLWHNRQALV